MAQVKKVSGVRGQGAASPALQMTGVRKRFGATIALDGVDFDVRQGEIHALVGENGAGKSTLMKVLSGAELPNAGEMQLHGAPFRPADPLDARRSGVAMIYQELSLADHLTVEENISLGVEPTRLGWVRRTIARDNAVRALKQLGHTDIQPDAPVDSLSVAGRQIVEIARAVATGCSVLVFDEPTSSLAREDVGRLFDLIRRLRDQGHAIVYISHFLEEVKEIADRFTVLRDGTVAGSGLVGDVSIDDIVSMMVGRQIEQLYPRSSRTPGKVVLSVSALAGMTKPTSAGFELCRGEVLGIAGLVGAGRTELLRAIFGLDKVRSGRIRVGTYTGGAVPARRLAQGLGMLSEDRKGEGLATSMTVADNLTLSRLRGMGPLGLILPSRQRNAAAAWITKLGIRCRGPEQRTDGLSGGNQQKVAIARLLHHDVDVLLLDEPTKGVDVASKAQIYKLIDDLAVGSPADGREPRAILMISSYLPELLGVCDRIAVMSRGELGPARPANEWDEHELLLQATGQRK